MSETIINKKCVTCQQIKRLNDFHLNKSAKDGHQSNCKNCTAIYIRQYYTKNKSRLTTQIGDYHKKHLEQHRDTCRRYYHRNKQACTVRSKQYRSKNRDKYCDYAKRHSERFPEQVKAHTAVRIAIQKGRLQKPTAKTCSCGNQAKQYHHNLGYEPEHYLDVVAVCIKCHLKLNSLNKST